MSETYEQAVARTGRKWPYRSKDWPCPACGNADCDLDVDLVYQNSHRSLFVYSHEPLVQLNAMKLAEGNRGK